MNLNMLHGLVSDHIRESRQIARLSRMGKRVAAVLAECDYAQRRWITLMTTSDAYLPEGDQAPGDYSEFLFRTSGALLREPDARRRANGQLVG
jgi:hypothetical protein